MKVSWLIKGTLLDTLQYLRCLELLVTEPGPGHQEAGQGNEGGQGGQYQEEGGQSDQHQGGLPGEARVERGEELGWAGDRRLT